MAFKHDISALKNSFEVELDNILSYWSTYTIDPINGGFYGEVDDANLPVTGAIKGSVLHARILWSFSAAYLHQQKEEHLKIAHRAFGYIIRFFIDKENGGVYWSINEDGSPADTKKQIYALAFTIYGFCEYYKATQNQEALQLAKDLYSCIQQYSLDKHKGGYLEAFTRDWKLIDDLRLSDKDANEKKTMNTHLHILEAYTNLYRVWPTEELSRQIKELIGYFDNYLIDPVNHHLVLFLDEDWQVRSDTLSYGHDIEASWLLQEAAEVLQDDELIDQVKLTAVKIAQAAAEGLNADGGLNYEYEPSHKKMIAERHWWVQAEAVVGYYNAYQNTGDEAFFDKAIAVWQYTQANIIDHKGGEWFWGRNADGTVMAGHGKAGFWKCPYHNSRACLEMIRRLNVQQ